MVAPQFQASGSSGTGLALAALAGAGLAAAAVVYLLRRLERRRDAELQALTALTQAISAAPDDAAEIAEAAFIHTARLLPSDFFQLGLFQADIYRTLIWVRDGDRVRNREFRLDPEQQGLIGWVRQHADALLVEDFRKPSQLPAQPSYESDDPPRAGLFVPILIDATVVGVVAVQSRRPKAFGRRELALLKAMSAGLGTALAALAWRDEVRLRERQLALVEEVAGLLTPLRALAEAMPQAAAIIAQRLEADQVAIQEVDGETSIDLATVGHLPGWQTDESSASIRRQAVASLSLQARPHVTPGGAVLVWECAAPLVVQDRAVGLLYLARRSRPFLGPDRRLVEVVASQLALAVLEAANYAQQQEEAWYTTVLLEVARHAARPGDVSAALQSVLQLTTLLAGAGWALILIADSETGRLHAGPSAGLRRESLAGLAGASFTPAELGFAAGNDDRLQRLELPPALAAACGGAHTFGLGLTDGRRLFGLLLIGAEQEQERRHALLAGIAHQVSLRLENASLVEEAAARRSLERELETARAIQESFLPLEPPRLPRWSVDAFWRAARSVGGDFFDFIPLPAGDNGPRWGLAIADVSDKGVPAALYMALSRTLLRSIAPSFDQPSATLARLNELLLNETRADMFVSLWYGIWEPATAHLRYANAGHCPPLVFRPDASPVQLTARQTVLGVLPEVAYRDEWLDLAPGSLLLLYTDGVSEASSGGDFFGVHRIENAVLGLDSWEPSTVLARLEDRLAAFSGRPDPQDDITIVCLHRLPLPVPALPQGGRHA